MTLTRRTTLALLASSVAMPAFAMKDKVFNSGGVAINGYDPVAYFIDGQPVEGKPGFTAEYDGFKFQFSSSENLMKFQANPASFAPQYGGYCAWAVSKGYTAKTDPDAWTIYDGKLYLNYNKSIRARWSKDKPTNISNGDANWPAVLN